MPYNKYKKQVPENRKGFSLVELSIVIVIIGLLIAAIAAGTSLIKQAELRSIITDFQNYASSYNTFRDRFNRVPGDMEVASAYFPTACSADADACNGNNNGSIDFAADNTNEVNAAWIHLEAAGMINYGFDTIAVSRESTIGTNAPTSKITAAGYYMIGWISDNGIHSAPFDNQNVLFLGRNIADAPPANATLTPEDAFAIDRKMDDGNVDSSGNFRGAQTGTIRSLRGVDFASTVNACITGSGASAVYNISDIAESCRIGMAL